MTTNQTKPFDQLAGQTTDPVDPYALAGHTVRMFADRMPGEKVRVDTGYIRQLIRELDSAEHPIFDELSAQPEYVDVKVPERTADFAPLGVLAPEPETLAP